MIQLDWMGSLRDLNVLSVCVRLLLAMAFGGTIGFERGIRQRAAGLRTHMLLCVGAASTMLVSQYIYASYGVGDPARLSAQVISGIGFLGAGIHHRHPAQPDQRADHGGNPLGHCLHGAGCRRRVLRMRLGHVCHFDLYSSFGQCGGHEILKNPHQYSALSGGPAGCRVGKCHPFHPRDRLERSRGQRIPLRAP